MEVLILSIIELQSGDVKVCHVFLRVIWTSFLQVRDINETTVNQNMMTFTGDTCLVATSAEIFHVLLHDNHALVKDGGHRSSDCI